MKKGYVQGHNLGGGSYRKNKNSRKKIECRLTTKNRKWKVERRGAQARARKTHCRERLALLSEDLGGKRNVKEMRMHSVTNARRKAF